MFHTTNQHVIDIFFPHFYLTYVLTFYLAVFLASILTSYVRVQACPTASGARDVGSIADHSSDKMAGEETRREEEEEEKLANERIVESGLPVLDEGHFKTAIVCSLSV